MIKSFADKATARLFEGERVRHVQAELARRAQRKLRQIHRARTLGDVAANPGNRLEKLSGDREGQWSIRVTGQWRICFLWLEGNAHMVWFGDYHG